MSTITNKGILNIEGEITTLNAKIHGKQAELEILISWRNTLVERLKQAIEEEEHHQRELKMVMERERHKRAKTYR